MYELNIISEEWILYVKGTIPGYVLTGRQYVSSNTTIPTAHDPLGTSAHYSLDRTE